MEGHKPETLTKARKLRREMSLPEGLLWNRLRGKPMGVKFRNQHPVAFATDGMAHAMGNRPQHDAVRDARLGALGIEVVRIAAADVLKDVDATAEAIVRLCVDRPPPSALRAATSPSGGGFLGVT